MGYETVEREIDVSELELGMHVVRLDCPWEQTNFPLQSFIVQSADDIDALQAQCKSVVIEGTVARARGANLHPVGGVRPGSLTRPVKSAQGNSGSPRVTYINKVDRRTEMRRATRYYADAKNVACEIMEGLRVGRALDINRAREVVNNCVDSILRNHEALLLLTKLKHKDEYTAEHSLNVSILAATFGKRLGLLEEEIRTLGMCGLLHDIGKTKMPSNILKKPAGLTPKEYGIVKKHPDWGRDMLMAVSNVPPAAIDVAYSHHERLDGQGYPRGLVAEQIPYFAKIVSIVDTYDAITSNRAYDVCRTSMEALEIIHRFRGKQFDASLAREFVLMIGIYSPGSIVLMKSGEVGIVVASNPQNRRKPHVVLVRDAAKKALPGQMTVHMELDKLADNGEPFAIAKELPDGSYNIFVQRFIEEGLVLGYRS